MDVMQVKFRLLSPSIVSIQAWICLHSAPKCGVQKGKWGGLPHGDIGVRKGHQHDDISFHYKKPPRLTTRWVSIPIGSKGQASSGLYQMFSKISFIYNQEQSLVNKTNKKCSFCFRRFP